MTRIKVCCIQDEREIRLAAHHGASAIGLVSRMPSGPGVLEENEIAALVPAVPDSMLTVLLTSRTSPAEILRQQRRIGADALQFVDRLEPRVLARLRTALPNVRLMPVIHVAGPESVDRARRLAPQADMLLLDSGRPDADVRELGGTGRTHDWSVSREIREAVEVPVWLAGGLDPDNVEDAVRRVAPHGVDVCSGLRSDGTLDEERLERFVRSVRGASRSP